MDMSNTTTTTTADVDIEAVTDASSTSSSEEVDRRMSNLDDELDALNGTDLGAFLLDTFVPDDVIGTPHQHPYEVVVGGGGGCDTAAAPTMNEMMMTREGSTSSSTDMTDVANAAMLMVDIPELLADV
mmetsp:Transcript_512/g.1285  ORF Transcript_512/g.1285 Transcript_512/m.1285 type:complete len:128 (+) Transcript_512:1308-1691(+)